MSIEADFVAPNSNLSSFDGDSEVRTDEIEWRNFIDSIRLSLDESVQLVDEEAVVESSHDNRCRISTPVRSSVSSPPSGRTLSSRKRRRRPRPAIHYSEDGGVLGNLPPPEGSLKLSTDRSTDPVPGKGTESSSTGDKKSGNETDNDQGSPAKQYFGAGYVVHDEKTQSWNLWYRPFGTRKYGHGSPPPDSNPETGSEDLHVAYISWTEAWQEANKEFRLSESKSENRRMESNGKSCDVHEAIHKPPIILFQNALRRREVAQLLLDAVPDAPCDFVENTAASTVLSTRSHSRIDYGKALSLRWRSLGRRTETPPASGDLNFREFLRAAGKVALAPWPPLHCPAGWTLENVTKSCMTDDKLTSESFVYRDLVGQLLLDCMKTPSAPLETETLDVVWPQLFEDSANWRRVVPVEPFNSFGEGAEIRVHDDANFPSGMTATTNSLHVLGFVPPESPARRVTQTTIARKDPEQSQNQSESKVPKSENKGAEKVATAAGVVMKAKEGQTIGDEAHILSESKPLPTISGDITTSSLDITTESPLSPTLHKKLAIQIKVTSLDDKSTAVAEAIIPSERQHTVECLVSTLDTKGMEHDSHNVGCQGSPQVRLVGGMTSTVDTNRNIDTNQEPCTKFVTVVKGDRTSIIGLKQNEPCDHGQEIVDDEKKSFIRKESTALVDKDESALHERGKDVNLSGRFQTSHQDLSAVSSLKHFDFGYTREGSLVEDKEPTAQDKARKSMSPSLSVSFIDRALLSERGNDAGGDDIISSAGDSERCKRCEGKEDPTDDSGVNLSRGPLTSSNVCANISEVGMEPFPVVCAQDPCVPKRSYSPVAKPAGEVEEGSKDVVTGEEGFSPREHLPLECEMAFETRSGPAKKPVLLSSSQAPSHRASDVHDRGEVVKTDDVKTFRGGGMSCGSIGLGRSADVSRVCDTNSIHNSGVTEAQQDRRREAIPRCKVPEREDPVSGKLFFGARFGEEGEIEKDEGAGSELKDTEAGMPPITTMNMKSVGCNLGDSEVPQEDVGESGEELPSFAPEETDISRLATKQERGCSAPRSAEDHNRGVQSVEADNGEEDENIATNNNAANGNSDDNFVRKCKPQCRKNNEETTSVTVGTSIEITKGDIEVQCTGTTRQGATSYYIGQKEGSVSNALSRTVKPRVERDLSDQSLVASEHEKIKASVGCNLDHTTRVLVPIVRDTRGLTEPAPEISCGAAGVTDKDEGKSHVSPPVPDSFTQADASDEVRNRSEVTTTATSALRSSSVDTNSFHLGEGASPVRGTIERHRLPGVEKRTFVANLATGTSLTTVESSLDSCPDAAGKTLQEQEKCKVSQANGVSGRSGPNVDKLVDRTDGGGNVTNLNAMHGNNAKTATSDVGSPVLRAFTRPEDARSNVSITCESAGSTRREAATAVPSLPADDVLGPSFRRSLASFRSHAEATNLDDRPRVDEWQNLAEENDAGEAASQGEGTELECAERRNLRVSTSNHRAATASASVQPPTRCGASRVGCLVDESPPVDDCQRLKDDDESGASNTQREIELQADTSLRVQANVESAHVATDAESPPAHAECGTAKVGCDVNKFPRVDQSQSVRSDNGDTSDRQEVGTEVQSGADKSPRTDRWNSQSQNVTTASASYHPHESCRATDGRADKVLRVDESENLGDVSEEPTCNAERGLEFEGSGSLRVHGSNFESEDITTGVAPPQADEACRATGIRSEVDQFLQVDSSQSVGSACDGGAGASGAQEDGAGVEDEADESLKADRSSFQIQDVASASASFQAHEAPSAPSVEGEFPGVKCVREISDEGTTSSEKEGTERQREAGTIPQTDRSSSQSRDIASGSAASHTHVSCRATVGQADELLTVNEGENVGGENFKGAALSDAGGGPNCEANESLRMHGSGCDSEHVAARAAGIQEHEEDLATSVRCDVDKLPGVHKAQLMKSDGDEEAATSNTQENGTELELQAVESLAASNHQNQKLASSGASPQAHESCRVASVRCDFAGVDELPSVRVNSDETTTADGQEEGIAMQRDADMSLRTDPPYSQQSRDASALSHTHESCRATSGHVDKLPRVVESENEGEKNDEVATSKGLECEADKKCESGPMTSGAASSQAREECGAMIVRFEGDDPRVDKSQSVRSGCDDGAVASGTQERIETELQPDVSLVAASTFQKQNIASVAAGSYAPESCGEYPQIDELKRLRDSTDVAATSDVQEERTELERGADHSSCQRKDAIRPLASSLAHESCRATSVDWKVDERPRLEESENARDGGEEEVGASNTHREATELELQTEESIRADCSKCCHSQSVASDSNTHEQRWAISEEREFSGFYESKIERDSGKEEARRREKSEQQHETDTSPTDPSNCKSQDVTSASASSPTHESCKTTRAKFQVDESRRVTESQNMRRDNDEGAAISDAKGGFECEADEGCRVQSCGSGQVTAGGSSSKVHKDSGAASAGCEVDKIPRVNKSESGRGDDEAATCNAQEGEFKPKLSSERSSCQSKKHAASASSHSHESDGATFVEWEFSRVDEVQSVRTSSDRQEEGTDLQRGQSKHGSLAFAPHSHESSGASNVEFQVGDYPAVYRSENVRDEIEGVNTDTDKTKGGEEGEHDKTPGIFMSFCLSENVATGEAPSVTREECRTTTVECRVEKQLEIEEMQRQRGDTKKLEANQNKENKEIGLKRKTDESMPQEATVHGSVLDEAKMHAACAVDSVEGEIASVVVAAVASKAVIDPHSRHSDANNKTESDCGVCLPILLTDGYSETGSVAGVRKEFLSADSGNDASDESKVGNNSETKRTDSDESNSDKGRSETLGEGCIEEPKCHDLASGSMKSSRNPTANVEDENREVVIQPFDELESNSKRATAVSASKVSADIRTESVPRDSLALDSAALLEGKHIHGHDLQNASQKLGNERKKSAKPSSLGFVEKQKNPMLSRKDRDCGHHASDPSSGASPVGGASLPLSGKEDKGDCKHGVASAEDEGFMGSAEGAPGTSSQNSAPSGKSCGDSNPRQGQAETEKSTGDVDLNVVEEEVQLFASHFDIGIESGLGRPKRRIKAVVRFQPTPLSYAEEKKNISYKTGTGFQCPQCKTLCQYDAQECPFCALKCCYIAGTGVVVLRDRADVGRDFPSFDEDRPEVKSDTAKEAEPVVESLTTLDSKSKAARREARRKAARMHRRSQSRNQTKLEDDVDPPALSKSMRTPTMTASRQKRARSRKRTQGDEALPTPPRFHGNVSQDNLSEDLKPWECETCLQVHTAKTFQRHRLRTHGLKWDEYGCPYCGCRFDCMESRADHIEKEHPDSVAGNNVEKCGFLLYFCGDCDYTHTVIGMSNHWRHTHGNDPSFSPHSLPLVCYFCIVEQDKDMKKKQFETVQNLEDHVVREHVGCTLITGKKLKEPQVSQPQPTQQQEVPSRRSKRTKRVPTFYGDSEECTDGDAEVGKDETVESREAKSATITRQRKRKLDAIASECGQDDEGNVKKVQLDPNRMKLDHSQLLESFGRDAAALGTKGRSVTDVIEDVDDKISNLEEKIQFRRKRDVNEGMDAPAASVDSEDEEYASEARLYNRSLRERQQQADGERIEKERFKEQCTSHLIVLKYQNRNKKKNVAEIEFDNLESRVIRQVSSDEYNAICEDARKSCCSEGSQCDLCNGLYASWITLTPAESAGAQDDTDRKDDSKEEERLTLLSPGFREIGFDSLYASSDSEDDEDDEVVLDEACTIPCHLGDSDEKKQKRDNSAAVDDGGRPSKRSRGEESSSPLDISFTQDDRRSGRKLKSEESSRTQQRGRLKEQNRRLKKSAGKWTDLRYSLSFVKVFNEEERLPFERHVVRGGSGSCRIVNYQASHR